MFEVKLKALQRYSSLQINDEFKKNGIFERYRSYISRLIFNLIDKEEVLS